MKKKGKTDPSIYLAQAATAFACFYVNIQGAKTKEKKNEVLVESMKAIKEFERKLKSCDVL